MLNTMTVGCLSHTTPLAGFYARTQANSCRLVLYSYLGTLHIYSKQLTRLDLPRVSELDGFHDPWEYDRLSCYVESLSRTTSGPHSACHVVPHWSAVHLSLHLPDCLDDLRYGLHPGHQPLWGTSIHCATTCRLTTRGMTS